MATDDDNLALPRFFGTPPTCALAAADSWCSRKRSCGHFVRAVPARQYRIGARLLETGELEERVAALEAAVARQCVSARPW